MYLLAIPGMIFVGCDGSGTNHNSEQSKDPEPEFFNEHAIYPQFTDPSLGFQAGAILTTVVSEFITKDGEEPLICESTDTFSGCFASPCVALADGTNSVRSVINMHEEKIRQFQTVYSDSNCSGEPYGMLKTRAEWSFTLIGESGHLFSDSFIETNPVRLQDRNGIDVTPNAAPRGYGSWGVWNSQLCVDNLPHGLGFLEFHSELIIGEPKTMCWNSLQQR